jgi:hypothetical protein
VLLSAQAGGPVHVAVAVFRAVEQHQYRLGRMQPQHELCMICMCVLPSALKTVGH